LLVALEDMAEKDTIKFTASFLVRDVCAQALSTAPPSPSL